MSPEAVDGSAPGHNEMLAALTAIMKEVRQLAETQDRTTRELKAEQEKIQLEIRSTLASPTTGEERLPSSASAFGLGIAASSDTTVKPVKKSHSSQKLSDDDEDDESESESDGDTDTDNEALSRPSRLNAVPVVPVDKVSIQPEFKYLPPPGNKGAPTIFNGPEDDAEDWLDRFESVANRGKLNDAERCEFILDYASLNVKGVIKAQIAWEKRNWHKLRKAIIQLYPYHTRSCQFTEADLRQLCREWALTEIEVDVQLEEYIREFMRVSHFLLKKKIIDEKERDYFFCTGFNKGLRDRIDHEIKWLDVHKAKRHSKKRAFPFQLVLKAVRSLFEVNQFETAIGATHSERIKEYEQTRKEEREVEKLRNQARLAALARQPAELKTLALPPIEAPVRREFKIASPLELTSNPELHATSIPSVEAAVPKTQLTEVEELSLQLGRLAINSQSYAAIWQRLNQKSPEVATRFARPAAYLEVTPATAEIKSYSAPPHLTQQRPPPCRYCLRMGHSLSECNALRLHIRNQWVRLTNGFPYWPDGRQVDRVEGQSFKDAVEKAKREAYNALPAAAPFKANAAAYAISGNDDTARRYEAVSCTYTHDDQGEYDEAYVNLLEAQAVATNEAQRTVKSYARPPPNRPLVKPAGPSAVKENPNLQPLQGAKWKQTPAAPEPIHSSFRPAPMPAPAGVGIGTAVKPTTRAPTRANTKAGGEDVAMADPDRERERSAASEEKDRIWKALAQQVKDTTIEIKVGDLLITNPRVTSQLVQSVKGRDRFQAHQADVGYAASGEESDSEEETRRKEKFSLYTKDGHVVLNTNLEEHPVAPESEKTLYAYGTARIQVTIGGKAVRALVDDGSMINVTNHSVVDKLGLACDPNTKAGMVTANGSYEAFQGICHDATINVGGLDTTAHLYVIEHSNYDLLLGMPWIKSVRGSTFWKGDSRWFRMRTKEGVREIRISHTNNPSDKKNFGEEAYHLTLADVVELDACMAQIVGRKRSLSCLSEATSSTLSSAPPSESSGSIHSPTDSEGQVSASCLVEDDPLNDSPNEEPMVRLYYTREEDEAGSSLSWAEQQQLCRYCERQEVHDTDDCPPYLSWLQREVEREQRYFASSPECRILDNWIRDTDGIEFSASRSSGSPVLNFGAEDSVDVTYIACWNCDLATPHALGHCPQLSRKTLRSPVPDIELEEAFGSLAIDYIQEGNPGDLDDKNAKLRNETEEKADSETTKSEGEESIGGLGEDETTGEPEEVYYVEVTTADAVYESAAVYKKVAQKIRPVDTDLPCGMKPLLRTPPDLLNDLPTVPVKPGGYRYGQRVTKERFDSVIQTADPSCSEDERKLINHVLVENELALAFDESEKGRFRDEFVPPYKNPLVDHTPWQHRPIPLPAATKDSVIELLREKLEGGVYEHSQAAYRSRFFLVAKKNGKFRIVHDLQPLNAVTIRDAGLPPAVEEFVEDFGGRSCLTMLDIFDGYGQRTLHPDSRDATSFQTPIGLLRITTLPQGATNSVSEYQRTVMFILKDEIPATANVFVDDVGIKGRRTKYEDPLTGLPETLKDNSNIRRYIYEHLVDVNRVLHTMKRYGGAFSGAKLQICAGEANIVGHLCSYEGRRIPKSALQRVEDWPACKNIKDVRAFLGTTGLFRVRVRGLG